MKQGDSLALLMYDAWTRHGKFPSKIYNLPKGELALIRAFYIIEKEKIAKQFKALKGR